MIIKGNIDGNRVPSRILEETIQQAIKEGAREITVEAQGQHGIGGRIWPKDKPIAITVKGPVGQRLGSMGMFGTEIIAEGGASDDVGWLNCGAKITVLGDVTNGAHNAGAQGILYVQGSGGARCDTMTKQNPRFEPLQSWYFRDVGDSFAEFKAGGVAVVCGVNPRHPDNILGARSCVGMVGGTIYFRGPIKDYSQKDVKMLSLSEQDWEWLTANMKPFLEAINRTGYYDELTRSQDEWRKLVAYTPDERKQIQRQRMSARDFRSKLWEPEVGKGGIFGDLIEQPFTLIPFITTGKDRRFKPAWNNEQKLPPCEAVCPSDIPSHKRFQLIRQGRQHEALSMILEYSPFPATVCGEICPNLCMKACTRRFIDRPLDMKYLGKMSMELPAPTPEKATGYRVAVVGGGPAGLSAAWQMAMKGHKVVLYEASERIGGKLWSSVEKGKLPIEVFDRDLARFKEIGIEVHTGHPVSQKQFKQIVKEFDGVIIACGAQTKDGKGLHFLTPDIYHANGKIKVNENGQTDNLKVFAAGDAVSRGLPTHAIGQGRRCALALHALMTNQYYYPETRPVIPYNRMKLKYFAFERGETGLSLLKEADRCVSCGLCRDCHICETSCYYGAISRVDLGNGEFEYVVDEDKCIGCGFCVGTCPSGVWEMEENL